MRTVPHTFLALELPFWVFLERILTRRQVEVRGEKGRKKRMNRRAFPSWNVNHALFKVECLTTGFLMATV